MKIKIKNYLVTPSLIAAASLAIGTGFSSAANISYVGISNDANSGISTANTYTHKLDFGLGTPGAIINGVNFDRYVVDTTALGGPNAVVGTTGLNFTYSVGPTGNAQNNAGNASSNVTGGLANLMTDMIYHETNPANATATWTLSGLTTGAVYDARIYVRSWDTTSATTARAATLVFDPDGAGAISDSTGLLDEDNATYNIGFSSYNQAYYINYRFTAVAGENLVITATERDLNQGWHLYGLTNQVVPEPSSAALLGLGGIALLIRRRR